MPVCELWVHKAFSLDIIVPLGISVRWIEVFLHEKQIIFLI